jgi:nitrite reductase (NAD(P)H)
MSSNWQPQVPVEEVKADSVEGGSNGVNVFENESHSRQRKKVVVVGLGMVGISFM